MKKFFIILVILLAITISILVVTKISYTNYKSEVNDVSKSNTEYEQFKDKEILGTDVATIINKAVNDNIKNNVQKDENNFYIDNGINSIQIDIKMTDTDEVYKMETIYGGQITNFVQYYNQIYFKITEMKYHEKSGRLKYILFEQVSE